ncbi:MAG: sigma-70 family RNA polymerase sigma factor [Elusimicrobiota bacterium]
MMSETSLDFADFYEEWFGRVYNYARNRTGSPTRADEVVSDTFSRVFKSWSRFDPAKADRRTWLFSIAFRAVADHYRAEKRRFWSPLELLEEPKAPGGGPAQAAEAAQDQKDLAAALALLEDQQREIVSLRFYGGMTNRAIAGLMGLTESNVAVILFRSVRQMRRSFPGVEA